MDLAAFSDAFDTFLKKNRPKWVFFVFYALIPPPSTNLLHQLKTELLDALDEALLSTNGLTLKTTPDFRNPQLTAWLQAAIALQDKLAPVGSHQRQTENGNIEGGIG